MHAYDGGTMMDPLMSTAAAFLAVLSALALYAGSGHCRWPGLRRRLFRVGTKLGVLLAALSLVLWIAVLGAGAGLCAMLAVWMSGLIAVPFLGALTGGTGNAGSDA